MEYKLKVLKISDNRIKILNNMNIYTIKDLIMHFPYRYETIEETSLINDTKVIIEGIIIDNPKLFFKGRLSRLSFKVAYKEDVMNVTIFNRHFLKKNMNIGDTITIIGKYNGNGIVASDIKLRPLKELEGVNPIYKVKEGINQKSMYGYVNKALNFYKGHFVADIPETYIKRHGLIDREQAYFKVHQPTNNQDIIQALRYLKYEEFLKFQLTMQYIKRTRTQDVGIAKVFDHKKVNELINNLPFKLTDDQSSVIDEIFKDLQSNTTMYRFIQGDVGSGKTIVATIGLYANYLAGFQGAMMAPTEILASQHYHSVKKLLDIFNVKVELLTGSLSVGEKRDVYQRLENGDIDIIIGTHALFQDKVTYHNLGMVLTDEQHRFGVNQRKALRDKGQKVDFLVMSATPIPRTLAISLYGDMDVSTIKTMPQGRIPIITKVINSLSMKPILKELKDYLASGGQCYVVCPLIEQSEASDSRNAQHIYQAMKDYFQGSYEVGLLHGKMDDEQKDSVMAAFKNNELQILVSTTVIEVGVDVSNANMMVIYNAERFGLSQLHQLRGRIGRGNQQGYCYLLSNSETDEAKQRLNFMEKSNDGFEISQFDLELRGPGDLLGNKQSGLPSFVIGDIFKDFNILEVARHDAIEILENNSDDFVTNKLITSIKNNLNKNNEYID